MRTRMVMLPVILLIGTAADAPGIAALALLQPGQWALNARDADFARRSVCLGDPRVLLQLRHAGAVCSRFVITNDPATTTVHYTCPGAGHGQTMVRVETPRLAQIQTQGFAANAPFDLTIEARRTGECADAKVSSR